MALTPKLIDPKLLDDLLQDCQSHDDLLGQDGLIQQLTKALVERALQGELTHHLGYDKHAPEGNNSGNSRNGTTPKTIQGPRPSRANADNSRSKCRVTVTASSSRSSSRKGRVALTAWTRKSFLCTPAA